jgi:putative transposase
MERSSFPHVLWSGRASRSTAAALRARVMERSSFMLDRRGLYSREPRRELSAVTYYRTPPRLQNVDYRLPRTYFLTFCVKDRARVFSDAVAAEIACKRIRQFRNDGWYWLYAYCVMPDHVHMLMRAREKGVRLSRIVAMIRSAISHDVRRLTRDFAWQRGYHERIVREGDDSDAALAYALNNPFRASLVPAGEVYRFCGVVDQWR